MSIYLDVDKVKIDINKVMANKGLTEGGDVLAYATVRTKDYMNKYVPKSKGYLVDGVFIPPGSLRKSARVDSEQGLITYNVPYARYQYYGKRMDGSHEVKNYSTPGTGKYWDKLMMTAEGEALTKEVQDYIDRR